jgi:hypothetical protein
MNPPDLAGKQPVSRRSAAGATDWRSLSHTPDCVICVRQPHQESQRRPRRAGDLTQTSACRKCVVMTCWRAHGDITSRWSTPATLEPRMIAAAMHWPLIERHRLTGAAGYGAGSIIVYMVAIRPSMMMPMSIPRTASGPAGGPNVHVARPRSATSAAGAAPRKAQSGGAPA